MRRTSLSNDNISFNKVEFSNWFLNLYGFTDFNVFWERGMTMSKYRSFWLHTVSNSVSRKKVSRKQSLSFLKSLGFLKFLFFDLKYWSVLRKYPYGIDIFNNCSAAPISVSNMFAKRLSMYDLFSKLKYDYIFYNYITSKKKKSKKFKILRPNFPICRGSDLFLIGGGGNLADIPNESIIDSMFYSKDYMSFYTNLVGVDSSGFNFLFLFDLFIIQILELYKIIIILFFFKIFK